MNRLVDLTTGEIVCLATGLTSTYAILLGVILTCVVEIKTRGKALSRNDFVDVDDATNLLHQYSEWLDTEQVLAWDHKVDGRTHDDLVRQFISERSEQARPMLEDTSLSACADVVAIGPQVGDTAPPSSADAEFFQRQMALDYATRWANISESQPDAEAIVEAAEKYKTFLQGE